MKKLLIILVVLISNVVFASEEQSLKIILTVAPGGIQDSAVRIIHRQLEKELNYPVILDYRPGGKGQPALNELFNNKKDHLVLIFTNISFLLENENSNLRPVSFYGTSPIYAIARDKISWSDLKNYCQSTKNINYGSAGLLSPAQLVIIQSERNCKNPLQHIPYKGGGPAIIDLLGGHVDLVISAWSPVSKHVELGELKILATVGPIPSLKYPSLPKLNSKISTADLDPMEMYFISASDADPRAVSFVTKALESIYSSEEFKENTKKNDILRPSFKELPNVHYDMNRAKLLQVLPKN